jgi:hypothetical protein
VLRGDGRSGGLGALRRRKHRPSGRSAEQEGGKEEGAVEERREKRTVFPENARGGSVCRILQHRLRLLVEPQQ